MLWTGELIAIGTVLCWTISVQCFEAASKKVGTTPVNIIRLTFALVLFSFFLFFRYGYILPVQFPARAWVYLSLSGAIGFFIGDIFLFKALVEIGPRVAMLIYSLAAPTAALIGWSFLDETYVLHQWAGMFVTLFGVGIVILEKNQKASRLNIRDISSKGVLFGFGAMFCQACGYILSKTGMRTESGYLDAFSSTQIRVISAFLCFIILFTITGKWGKVMKAVKDKRALLFTAFGSALGPFLGVSLSLLALHYLTTGVASTFFSLVPIFIIPFSIFLHKEHVSIRAVTGAVTAVFGIYLLMM
ncbi:MAG: DMT family transporter [Desulfobacula sp.]|jgi:drug/metabolite transporter (DMT)-like permease|uniref:DMT family transporter n=1 Tax=Desulfobacula sp. TaxID=2593537 RepID=UPI001D7B2FD0|nr:DMT family transporter [Desulfobacula sp.]MBT3805346.1 DMT family transporter [Desulfobacula sp.]MBT4024499.1 DMT family transporter [Desulfobacula sp.]MBT4199819.1 DMT family transporter [Desulfobacula sp.]MBT4507805.1 DMT family transporter [Desulfobacula sp.]